MNKEGYINEAEENILHTYNRFSLVLDHGEGVYLYDTDGKEYLDFAAGIAVQAFGYGNKEYGDALKAQIVCSLPTVVQRQSKVQSRQQKNTLTRETDMQDMRSLQ